MTQNNVIPFPVNHRKPQEPTRKKKFYTLNDLIITFIDGIATRDEVMEYAQEYFTKDELKFLEESLDLVTEIMS